MHNIRDRKFDCLVASKKKMPLVVLFLEIQPCIRALKYAIGLKHLLKRNVSIILGYTGHPLSDLYGFGEEYFSRTVNLNSNNIEATLKNLIEKYQPHIIHSHNAPDTLTLKAIDTSGKIPVIHDVHEILSIHQSGFFIDDDEDLSVYQDEERRACENSDGRIYATKGIELYLHQQYNVDYDKEIVFPNYASESMMPKCFKKKLSSNDGEFHIVYVGCLTSVIDGSHYDLRDIFKRIADQRIHIHFYPTKNKITRSNEEYRRIAEKNRLIHYHEPMEYNSLLYEITQYDFGWAGLNDAKNRRHLDVAIQNKIFDYICCGLPIIAFPHYSIKRFIEKNGFGFVIKELDELYETLRNIDTHSMREHLLRNRYRMTVENNISNLVDFYNGLVEVKGD